MERLQGKCEDVLNTLSEEELEEKHRKFLRETMMVRTDGPFSLCVVCCHHVSLASVCQREPSLVIFFHNLLAACVFMQVCFTLFVCVSHVCLSVFLSLIFV